MPSIKEQDLLTTGEKLRRLARPLFFLVPSVYFAFVTRNVLKPSPADDNAIPKFLLFELLSMFNAAVAIGCMYLITVIITQKYRNNIKVDRVTEAKCPQCKQVSRMEIYDVSKGYKTEIFDQVKYTWEDHATRIHCTSCGFGYDCEAIGVVAEDKMKAEVHLAKAIEDIVIRADSEKMRRRPNRNEVLTAVTSLDSESEKDSLTKPLLSSGTISVEIV